ncbi:MAG: hypothetical protein ABSA07_01965 [Acidimicrobiales bacterium]
MKRHLPSVILTMAIAVASFIAVSLTPLSGSALATTTGTKTLPGPSAAVGGLIEASSCVAGPICVALGWNHHGNTSYLWAARWQGDGWTRLQAPPEGNRSGPGITAISCTTKSWCMVTGTNDRNRPIAEELIGTQWTTVRVPAVKGSSNFSIFKVSCETSQWCVGVGSYVANKPNYSDATFLVSETWNGSTWRIVPIDSPRTYAPQLDPGMVDGGEHPTASPQQISCVSKRFCMLAGFWMGVFVEEWNGRSWTKVTAPNAPIPGYDSEFSGGTCLSTTFCIAVGGYPVSNAAWRPLIEQWNGRSWHIVTMPRLPHYFNGKPGFNITGVECSSTTRCEAFGDQTIENSGVNGLMWNGRSWRYVATGIRRSAEVVCLSNDHCQLMG